LIDADGTVLAAVPVQVALAVAIDVEPAHHATPLYRSLPHGCVEGIASPRKIARQPTLTDRSRAVRVDVICLASVERLRPASSPRPTDPRP
jgi:hypothetical protein